jgi:hypothetical protein
MDVWYKLDDHQARRVKILTEDSIVEDLKDAIKEEAANTLKGVDTFLLRVYAADADPSKDKRLPGDRKVSECRASSYDEPFIVQAPPKQPQQPNGKFRCCRCLISYCCIPVCC